MARRPCRTSMDVDPIKIRVNARPTELELSDLCESVGWKRFGEDFVALQGYALTTSAWTSDGMLIAWTSVVSDNVRHAFLLDVMVHPAFQKKGIGRAVVLRAIEEMRQRGVTAFHVDCATENAPFYEKCGFKMCAGGWMDLDAKPTPMTAVLRDHHLTHRASGEVCVVVETNQPAVAAELAAALGAWNEAQAGPRNTERFTLSVRGANGELLGGLVGEMFWSCLYISVLWVKDDCRGKGYGTALMNRAEEIAKARPCDVVFLTTMTFQAPQFYESCGYTRFAELDAAPEGFNRIWFMKRLNFV